MVLPTLIAAILLVPFVMNFLAHAWFGEKHFPPLVKMKLPADSSVITLPREVKQFKPFEITLRLDTKELALRINDIVKNPNLEQSRKVFTMKFFPKCRQE